MKEDRQIEQSEINGLILAAILSNGFSENYRNMARIVDAVGKTAELNAIENPLNVIREGVSKEITESLLQIEKLCDLLDIPMKDLIPRGRN